MNVSLSRRRRIAVVLLVVGVFWLPRATALGHFVTPDEPRWVTRSANFYQALWAGRPVDTFQSNHPGVTAMWVGTVTFVLRYPEYPDHIRAQVPMTFSGVEAVLRAQGRSTLGMLVTARFLMLIVETIVLVAAGWYAARLLGFGPTVAGFALLAIDSFHIPNTRILHLDALQGGLMLLSVLALVSHARAGGKSRDLVISGVVGGLAMLTKISAIVLIPFAGLFILLEAWRTRSTEPGETTDWIKQTARTFIIWSVSAVLIALIIWPTTWGAPLHTFEGLFRISSKVGGSAGNQAPDFFMGRIQRDVGALFYPVSYLWAAMPLVWGGLVLAAVAAARRWAPFDEPGRRFAYLVLLAFAVAYVAELMLAGIKAQRYLLPAHLEMVLLAGSGWVAGMLRVWRIERPRAVRIAAAAALALLVAQHVAALIRSAPYYYTYDNALMGGRRTLRKVMTDGEGEGLELAARYLNAKPDADRLVVCSWYGYGPFSYFFRGQTSILEARWSDKVAQRLDSADYLVAYEHQWKRQLPSAEFISYLDRLEPEHVVRIDGLEYVRIYRLRGTPIAAELRRLHLPDSVAMSAGGRS